MEKLELLKQLNKQLKSFPFDSVTLNEVLKMDLDKISKKYENAEDDIENAIVWSANTLRVLINNLPIRVLDENIAYNESVIKDAEAITIK